MVILHSKYSTPLSQVVCIGQRGQSKALGSRLYVVSWKLGYV